MQAIELKIYEIFKSKLGESEAQTIIEYFDAKASSKIEERKDIFLTKDDKLELIDRIDRAKYDTIKWIIAAAVFQVVAIIVAKYLS